LEALSFDPVTIAESLFPLNVFCFLAALSFDPFPLPFLFLVDDAGLAVVLLVLGILFFLCPPALPLAAFFTPPEPRPVAAYEKEK
jgi:hypothetical protein